MNDSLYVLGVRIDRFGANEVIERIESLIEAGGPHHVVTVNPEFVVMAQSNPEFKKILLAADLALPDGVGLLWAARFVGRPLQGRVTGVDTVDRLASLCACSGYRPFLLGGLAGVAEHTAAALQAKYPGLSIAGTYAGSPGLAEEETIVDRIRAAQPHILFVAYGAPQQDVWIYRNLPKLGDVVAMGVGGAFDFLSGRVKRAPAWMQNAGLEWLYRLMREPWRWRRMLRLPKFVWLVARSQRQLTGKNRPRAEFDKGDPETYT